MKYVIALLFACTACFAQSKKFTIIDSETKKPVPYASVGFNGIGTFADADGAVTISDTLVKKIKVSSIGYKDKESVLDNIKDILTLDPEPIELKEVIIMVSKWIKRNQDVTSPKKHQDSGALFMSSVGLQYAFLVTAEKKDAYVSTVVLPLIKIAFEAEGNPGVFEKVPFYTLMKIEVLENNNGMPGEKLYEFEQYAVVSNTVKDKQFEILLSEEVPIKENGVFLQLTMMGRANADGSLTGELGYIAYKDANGEMKKWMKYCQPNFPLVERPKGSLTFIRQSFSEDKAWKTINEPHLHNPGKDYPDFNIGFGYTTVTYE
jgi:hypothetical protein